MSALSEERQMIQRTAREFARKDVLPIANRLDPVAGEIPMELRQKMADLGYFGMLIPQEHGGLGLGLFEYVLVTEELARAWMSVASIIARGNGLMGGGYTEEQRRRYLPRVARGEFLGCFALSEPEAGSDAANVQCRARRDGDGWLITGSKMWSTFADGADYILLVARVGDMDPARKHAGIRQFFIEKERGKLPPGVDGRPLPTIGYHGWRTFELHFDNLRLPASALLGEESQDGGGALGGRGSGFGGVLRALEIARVHTAARSIGLARGALEDSIRYAEERVQFGQPIARFQAIRFKIAGMATEIEAARALLYQVAAAIDAGEHMDKESSMVKLFASEMSERVTSEAIQIHGGYGYTTDFAVERYWRDARLTKIFEGTSEIQLRIISDRLLGK